MYLWLWSPWEEPGRRCHPPGRGRGFAVMSWGSQHWRPVDGTAGSRSVRREESEPQPPGRFPASPAPPDLITPCWGPTLTQSLRERNKSRNEVTCWCQVWQTWIFNNVSKMFCWFKSSVLSHEMLRSHWQMRPSSEVGNIAIVISEQMNDWAKSYLQVRNSEFLLTQAADKAENLCSYSIKHLVWIKAFRSN